MKKSVLTILLVTAFVLGYAQKGTVLLTGSAGYNSRKNSTVSGNDSKSSTLSITPGIGYQIAEQWTLGLNLGYSRTASSYVSNTYSIGPYVRYTKQLTEFISVYGQVQSSYGQSHYPTNPNNYPSARFISFFAIPAVEFNLGKGFGLNFNIGGLGYNVAKYDGTSVSDKYFSLSLGSGFGFGLSKRFGTKK